MGKRKAKTRKAPGPKKQGPLATTFTCLFCNHEHSVQCKIDKKAGVGDLYCKTCGQKFQTTVSYLSAAVDVYADWIDACELVAKDAANEEARITKEDRAFSKYADEAPIRSTNTGQGTSEKDEVDAAYESDY